MAIVRSYLLGLAEYFGAHRVPDRDAHELDRTRQRVILCAVIAAFWGFDFLTAPNRPREAIASGVLGIIAIASFAYWRFIRSHPGGGMATQYFSS